jgi:hypothetical protein
MRYIQLICLAVVAFIAACGGKSSSTNNVLAACETVADCECGENQEPFSCAAEGYCVCVERETIVETVEKVIDCNTECVCATGFTALCLDNGVCECLEQDLECYNMTRSELAQLIIAQLVEAEFISLQALVPDDPTFTDIPTTREDYEAIEASVALGILDGDESNGALTGTFRPEGLVTRAEASKAVYIAFGFQTVTDPPPSAEDLESEQWFYDYIVTLINGGVTEYYTDGRYAPNEIASSCFVKLAVERAEEFLPQDFDPRVYFTLSSSIQNFEVSPGHVDAPALKVSMATIEDVQHSGFKATIYLSGFADDDPPPVDITQVVESAELWVNGSRVAETLQVINIEGPYDDMGQLTFTYDPIQSEAYRLTDFTVRLSLQENIPSGVQFITALVPCNEQGFYNVAIEDMQGEPVYAHPSNGGCTVLNGPWMTVTEETATIAVSQTGPEPFSAPLSIDEFQLLEFTITPLINVILNETKVRIEIKDSSGQAPVMPTQTSEYLGSTWLQYTWGNLLAGPQSPSPLVYVASQGILFTEMTLSGSHTILKDETLELAVVNDLGAQFPQGYQIRVGVRYADLTSGLSSFRDLASGENIPLTQVSGAGDEFLFGPWITVTN